MNAGHNPDGRTACGATGLIKESTEARKVVSDATPMLVRNNHVVYDTTVNNGTSQNDVLNKIVNLTKRYDVDLHVSVHFNSGANDEKGNGKTTGVEVWVYDNSGLAGKAAKAVCESVSRATGLKNRGVKVSKELAFLKRTIGPAILIECCFVDDLDDCRAYNSKAMARAIVEGLTGQPATTTPVITTGGRKYINGDYNRKGKVVGTNGTGLNVRTDRNANSDKVKNLPEGTVIEVNYCKDNWFSTYDVKHNGKPCYVSGAYIEFI